MQYCNLLFNYEARATKYEQCHSGPSLFSMTWAMHLLNSKRQALTYKDPLKREAILICPDSGHRNSSHIFLLAGFRAAVAYKRSQWTSSFLLFEVVRCSDQITVEKQSWNLTRGNTYGARYCKSSRNMFFYRTEAPCLL